MGKGLGWGKEWEKGWETVWDGGRVEDGEGLREGLGDGRRVGGLGKGLGNGLGRVWDGGRVGGWGKGWTNRLGNSRGMIRTWTNHHAHQLSESSHIDITHWYTSSDFTGECLAFVYIGNIFYMQHRSTIIMHSMLLGLFMEVELTMFTQIIT